MTRGPRRVLFFSPFLPLPVLAGNRKRVVSMLDALAACGATTRLLCAGRPEDQAEFERAEGDLLARGVSSVEVYRPGSLDFHVGRARAKLRELRTGASGIGSVVAESPFSAQWMRREIDQFEPDVVWCTYAANDGLFDHARLQDRVRVIDMIDLIGIIHPYLALIEQSLAETPWQSLQADTPILDENYFDSLGLTASPEELAIYDRYSVTLAISPSEADVVSRNTSQTRVVYLPMAYDVAPERTGDETAAQGALLVLANAAVNVLGFAFFAKRVLPEVQRLAPDFSVRVVGAGGHLAQGMEGCEAIGFVDDLDAEYARARFAIVPTLGFTGQQVRIVEAMAQGIPVVAMEGSARSSPMKDGENGLVARTAGEFAEHVVRLWRDPALCRRLGRAAREAIAATCSTEKLTGELERAVFGSVGAERTRTQGEEPTPPPR